MKKIIVILFLFSANCFSQAISLTGQLTLSDSSNIGNASNYIRVKIIDAAVTSDPPNIVKSDAITVQVAVWKSKSAYNSNRPALQAFETQITRQIKTAYIISAATIATSPQANFNSLSGKTLRDKQLFWVLTQVLNQIIADNPTFSGSVVDVNL